MSRRFASITLLALAALAGCAPAPEYPETCPVEVIVTKNGEPLEGAIVSFINLADGQSGSGLSDQHGQVAVTTFQEGDGLVAGKYKVTIRKSESVLTPDPQDPDGPPLEEKVIWHVPQKYSQLSSTPFEVEVAASGENTFTFDVEE